jgi:hypothetical protein
MKDKIRLLFGGIVLALAGCASNPPSSGPIPKPLTVTAPKLIPLKLYWNGRDNFTTATAEGEAKAQAAGYQFIRIEGYVFANPQSNTIPLNQYWSAKRRDYLLLGKALSKSLNKNAHYKLIRIEGYAYASPQPDTVPLKRYSLPADDNFTLSTTQGENDALAAGYGLRRIEAYVIPAQANSNTVEQMTNFALINPKGIVLKGHDRLNTPYTFRPPVEITIVAKTDSTNLRIGYAADQVIFNWERNPDQLRVDGGPAGGLHKAGAGDIPADKFVTIRWQVTPNHQAIYVDDELRFEHSGDYSNLNRCVSVFPAVGSKVTVKSISVKPLSPVPAPPLPLNVETTPPPAKIEPVSPEQILKWIAQLADADFSKRESAVNELAQNSTAALPALEQSLKTETDSDRRWWIQSAIQECEQQQPKMDEISASPDAAQGLQVSEACKAGDGPFAVVERNGVRCWEVSKKGSYLYFIAGDEFRQKATPALEIQVEYLDTGTGDIALDYDSTDRRARVGGVYKNHSTVIHCSNSGQWRKTRFHLPDARFRGDENCQSDFRFYNGGDDMIIRDVRVWPSRADE